MTELTLEQQREIVRRMEEGHRYGAEMQAREASLRTEAEQWRIADRLMQGIDYRRLDGFFTPARAEEDGLVLAQRRFMKLRAAR